VKKFDETEVKNMFLGYACKGKDMLNNPDKIKETLRDAKKKANETKDPLDKVWHDLQLMFQLVGDWVKGDYREIPAGSIAAIIGALIYFLSPIDVIPDFIPGVGYIDDVFVLGLALKQVSSDLQKYEQWKNSLINME